MKSIAFSIAKGIGKKVGSIADSLYELLFDSNSQQLTDSNGEVLYAKKS